jgi:hypothetical protein
VVVNFFQTYCQSKTAIETSHYYSRLKAFGSIAKDLEMLQKPASWKAKPAACL